MAVESVRNYASINIAELRKRTGLSRQSLVNALAERGVSLQPTSLKRIEEGTQQVKIEELIAFSDIFDISFEDLIMRPLNESEAKLVTARQDLSSMTTEFVTSAFDFLLLLGKAQNALKDDDAPSPQQSQSALELERIVRDSKPMGKLAIEVVGLKHPNSDEGGEGLNQERVAEFKKVFLNGKG